jgi:hypothetical protein
MSHNNSDFFLYLFWPRLCIFRPLFPGLKYDYAYETESTGMSLHRVHWEFVFQNIFGERKMRNFAWSPLVCCSSRNSGNSSVDCEVIIRHYSRLCAKTTFRENGENHFVSAEEQMFLPVDGGIGPVPCGGPAVRPHSRQRTDNISQNKIIFLNLSWHCHSKSSTSFLTPIARSH